MILANHKKLEGIVGIKTIQPNQRKIRKIVQACYSKDGKCIPTSKPVLVNTLSYLEGCAKPDHEKDDEIAPDFNGKASFHIELS